jgi:hypothetical protein
MPLTPCGESHTALDNLALCCNCARLIQQLGVDHLDLWQLDAMFKRAILQPSNPPSCLVAAVLRPGITSGMRGAVVHSYTCIAGSHDGPPLVDIDINSEVTWTSLFQIRGYRVNQMVYFRTTGS